MMNNEQIKMIERFCKEITSLHERHLILRKQDSACYIGTNDVCCLLKSKFQGNIQQNKNKFCWIGCCSVIEIIEAIRSEDPHATFSRFFIPNVSGIAETICEYL